MDHPVTRSIPQPIDMEAIHNYLLLKKYQKQYYNHSYNVCPLPQLNLGQEVFFLSTLDQSAYIPSTIIDQDSTPQSYNIEAQGKQNCRTRQHIWPFIWTHPLLQMYHYTQSPKPSKPSSCIPTPESRSRVPLCPNTPTP